MRASQEARWLAAKKESTRRLRFVSGTRSVYATLSRYVLTYGIPFDLLTLLGRKYESIMEQQRMAEQEAADRLLQARKDARKRQDELMRKPWKRPSEPTKEILKRGDGAKRRRAALQRSIEKAAGQVEKTLPAACRWNRQGGGKGSGIRQFICERRAAQKSAVGPVSVDSPTPAIAWNDVKASAKQRLQDLVQGRLPGADLLNSIPTSGVHRVHLSGMSPSEVTPESPLVCMDVLQRDASVRQAPCIEDCSGVSAPAVSVSVGSEFDDPAFGERTRPCSVGVTHNHYSGHALPNAPCPVTSSRPMFHCGATTVAFGDLLRQSFSVVHKDYGKFPEKLTLQPGSLATLSQASELHAEYPLDMKATPGDLPGSLDKPATSATSCNGSSQRNPGSIEIDRKRIDGAIAAPDSDLQNSVPQACVIDVVASVGLEDAAVLVPTDDADRQELVKECQTLSAKEEPVALQDSSAGYINSTSQYCLAHPSSNLQCKGWALDSPPALRFQEDADASSPPQVRHSDTGVHTDRMKALMAKMESLQELHNRVQKELLVTLDSSTGGRQDVESRRPPCSEKRLMAAPDLQPAGASDSPLACDLSDNVSNCTAQSEQKVCMYPHPENFKIIPCRTDDTENMDRQWLCSQQSSGSVCAAQPCHQAKCLASALGQNR